MRTRYIWGPMCSFAPPLDHFLSFSLSLLSFSFLFFPVLLLSFFPFLSCSSPFFLSFSFLFFPFLSLSFTDVLYFSLSFGHWRFSKCNSMTAPAQVNARWSDCACSFPPADCNASRVGATSTSTPCLFNWWFSKPGQSSYIIVLTPKLKTCHEFKINQSPHDHLPFWSPAAHIGICWDSAARAGCTPHL